VTEVSGSTVRHKLATLSTKGPIHKITKGCVLDHCEPDEEKPWRQGLKIQQSIRGQYYRTIAVHPGQAYKLTYGLNCPPCGFFVTPWTRPCRNHRVCPWCFARRLVGIYDALREPEPKIRNLCRLVAWQREMPIGGELPFFRANYGPHTWLNAKVTVQLVVPYLHVATGNFRLRHVGIQLIPRSEVDFDAKLKRNCVNPALQVFNYNTAMPTNIYKAFNTVLKFPWLDLYLAENRDKFENLMDMYPKQKLLRISRYKPEGTKRGH